MKNKKIYIQPKEIRAGRPFEYNLSEETIKELLRTRRGADAKKDAHEYLCDYINEQRGLLGTCIRVIAH